AAVLTDSLERVACQHPHPGHASRQLRLKRVVAVSRAVAEVVDVLCPAVRVVEGPALVAWHEAGGSRPIPIALQRGLVQVNCLEIAREYVRPLVADVAELG